MSVFKKSILQGSVPCGSFVEDSALSNANFSDLSISHITKESAMQDITNISNLQHSNHKGNVSIAQNSDGTLKNKGHSERSTKKDMSSTSVTLSANEEIHDNKEQDESIIPVDDDDDMEVTVEGDSIADTPQNDMFAHLQLKNAAFSTESEIENEKLEYFIDEEVSYFHEDESNIFNNSLIEVGRRLWPSTAEKQHYIKGCLWSPDGTCLLSPVHLDGMHIMELPTDLYTLQELPEDRGMSDLTSAVHVKEGGTVYDFCWYPYMNSSDPTTCCWLATRQHEPIHMWDAFSGELRCSYRGYDDVDEVEAAISVVFSNDAQKVIGGFKKTIKVFDTNIPGRDSSSVPVKQAVSCFALNTDNDNCVTAGTWTGYINHYDLRAPKLGTLFTLGGHSGGITWLKYAPTLDSSWFLFSGARKDEKILQWDMRNYTEPIQTFQRTVETNQRIYYDLTPFNNWLASGGTDGLLRIWNLTNKDQTYELPLHQDCCNGVSFHPSLPIISSTSGQFHFVNETEPGDKSSEKVVNYENSLLMLWYGPSQRYLN